MNKDFVIAEGKVVPADSGTGTVRVYVSPDDAEKTYLVKELGIDEHTLNSALDPDELSRLEFEPEHVALILKRPKGYCRNDPLLFGDGSTGIFLFKDKMIIVLNEEIPLFSTKPFNRVTSLNDLLLKLMFGAITSYLDRLRVINTITDDLEQKINASFENRYLISLFNLEKILVYFLKSITANGTLIERLRNASSRLGFGQEQSEFLDDITIENTQCLKQAEIYSNILASLMDARASIVGNNLNILMKTLNLITIGIMVPTLVVSVFSMNVGIPFQEYPGAFWGILGLAALSLIGVMVWWKKRPH
jgi:magnesium transporter